MQAGGKHGRFKWIFFILLMVMFLSFSIPIPLNLVYDAIEIKLDDASYVVPCQVKVSGKYHMNLFNDDMFDGQISISDYRLTDEKMSEVYFAEDGWPLEYSYAAGYDNDDRPNRYTYFLGRLYSKSWFRNMAIIVYSDNPVNKDGGGKAEGDWGGWNENDGYCIVPLAADREDAIEILSDKGIIDRVE